ncbi:MAG: hypothetical protein H0W90_11995 [Actinobacteria bacterium]|nr:hypothetical protein [Actinomycetota bacterium]
MDDIEVATLPADDQIKASDAKDAKLERSFEKVLTGAELSKLLQVGREQLYVVIDLKLVSFSGDQKIVELDAIDVGDPGE